MQLTLGFSPCPNDTFIFDAMVHHRIDTEGLTFDVIMEDVEQLNKRAKQGELQVTKLSYHAYAYLRNEYNLLSAGSALGNGCGPLLIARQHLTPTEVNEGLIAIPGQMTTAHFLFTNAWPKATNKRSYLFSEIENAVLNGEVSAGVIIHENRFTYADKGLVKLMDLGEYWEQKTGLPIPLGGIVARKDLSEDIVSKLERVLKRSVLYAFEHPEKSQPFIQANAQEMSPEVARLHIELYVNDYSIALGEKGNQAVAALLEVVDRQLLPVK